MAFDPDAYLADTAPRYETALTPEQEQQFAAWKEKYAPKDSGADYDLRGAFKAGVVPDDKTGHWPDTFKKPNHPTFSTESVYAADRPDLAGTWVDGKYVPAAADSVFNPDKYLASKPTPLNPAQRDLLAQSIAEVITSGTPMPAMLAKLLLTKGGRVGDIASEVIPAIGGAVVGSFIEPGGGTIVGGASGAAAGNTLKQTREMIRGDRESFGPGELAMSTVAGAIPVPGLKPAGTALATGFKILAARGLQGAVVSGGAEAGREMIDEGKIDPAAIARNTVVGGVVGSVLGAGEGALVARRMARVITPHVDASMPVDDLPGAMRAAADEAAPAGLGGSEPPLPPATVALAGETPPAAKIPAWPGVPAAAEAKPLGLIKSAKESPEIVPALRDSLEGYYNPQSNKETIAEATRLIDQAGDLQTAKAAILGEQNPDAVSHAMGLELVRKFQVEGKLEDAADVLYNMAQKAKTQGQAIQILSTLSRTTPEGMAAYAQKILDRKLTPAELAEIAAGMKRIDAATAPEVKLARQADLLDQLNSKVPAPLADKLVAAQNISMLLNPKTAIRNIAGNVLMAIPELGSDAIVPAVDAGVSVFTGKRTVGGPQIVEYFKGLAQPARDVRLGYQQARSEGAGKMASLGEGFKTMATLAKLSSAGAVQITDVNRGFRTVFTQPLMRSLEKTLTVGLGVPDRAFYTARLRASLRNQVKVAGAAVPTGEMVDRAAMEAARSVYQDPNFFSKRLGEIKRTLNWGESRRFGLGQVIVPFTQVPGALLMRGLEYSPAGFLKAAYKFLPERLTGKAFDQRAFSQDFTRALLGTASLSATGYWLSRLGVLTGAPDDNKDVEAMRRGLGMGAYRINVSELKRRMQSMDWTSAAQNPPPVGDVITNYDWAQPVAFPVALGADLADSERRNKVRASQGKYVRSTSDVLNSVISGARTIEEQPMLTGLSGFFSAAAAAKSGQGAGAVEALYNSMLNLPGVYVPAAARGMQQFMDNRIYETRGTNAMETAYQRAAANVPGLATALGYKPKYDVMGDLAQRYQANGNSAFNVFINPAFVTEVKGDPQLRELYRIWQQTGETKELPRMVDQKITINGNQKVLTAPQVADYQQFVGRLTRDSFQTLMRNDGYSRASDDQRAKVMAQVLGAADQAARVYLFGDRPRALDKWDRALIGMAQREPAVRPLMKTAP